MEWEETTLGATIVLADDESDLRAALAAVLRRDGHDVHEACDGLEALALVASLRPVLLLLDVWMPGVNGFEVLDRLRGDPDAMTLKVVMLSNLGDADTCLEGYSAGVGDYWVKGMAVDEFRDRVRQALKGSVADGG